MKIETIFKTIRKKELASSLTPPITPQAVSKWKQVPPDKVIQVEAITGISRHKLRPDIFGDAP